MKVIKAHSSRPKQLSTSPPGTCQWQRVSDWGHSSCSYGNAGCTVLPPSPELHTPQTARRIAIFYYTSLLSQLRQQSTPHNLDTSLFIAEPKYWKESTAAGNILQICYNCCRIWVMLSLEVEKNSSCTLLVVWTGKSNMNVYKCEPWEKTIPISEANY